MAQIAEIMPVRTASGTYKVQDVFLDLVVYVDSPG